MSNLLDMDISVLKWILPSFVFRDEKTRSHDNFPGLNKNSIHVLASMVTMFRNLHLLEPTWILLKLSNVNNDLIILLD